MPNDTQSNEGSTAGQEITRPQSVYLSLGSNLGDREANLHEAVERIRALGLEITGASSIYETEPVGYKEQPWFLNQVVEVRVAPELTLNYEVELAAQFEGESNVETEMASLLRALPEKEPELASTFWIVGLLKAMQSIEREMGRERTIPDGPRVIDIDILIYGKTQCSWAETHGESHGTRRAGPPFLILPHPRLHERRFVLEPLCEIAPDLIHPEFKKTCRELLADLNDPSTITLFRNTTGNSR